jgi:hypothetical protein
VPKLPVIGVNSRPAVDAARAQYQRLRAGAQAVVALGLGVFAVGMGAEGWHYAREVGASGDDYTGLLAIPQASCWLPWAS